MPTRPVITPISLRKRWGTSWNTAPLPIPSDSMAHTKTARACQASGRPKLTMARNSAASTYITVRLLMPPMRSATLPPMGRTRLPANTQAAVKKPAVFGSSPYWVLK
jgi:hypothetical protein